MKNVPFFKNSEDNTHCYQAALKIVLKHYLPGRDFTFEELDQLTDKVKDKWTWPQAGLISLMDLGFEIVIIDTFDYARFIENGVEYLKQIYGDEIAHSQAQNSDIPNAIKHSQKLIEKNIEIKNQPTLQLLKSYVDQEYLVICNINSAILNNTEGYTGHFVVVYKIDNKKITFHDPGLPSHKGRVETLKTFYEAWEPTKDAYAIKLRV